MQDNIITIKFADSKVPEFKESRGDRYIKFGEEDNYPNYLIYLLNKSAKHNSIVNSKTTYIYGGGLAAETPDPIAEAFIAKNNDLMRHIILDREAFGGGYIQCIPTRDMKGFCFHHISFEKIRTNKKKTRFFFKEDWKDRAEDMKEFTAFDPAKKVNSVFMFKEHRPGTNVYALPGFMAAINYIESDIEVSKHTLTNAQSGFSASKFINFFNGEPTEDQKRSIEKRFLNKYSGAEGIKSVIGFNAASAAPPTVQDLGTSDLTKEDFSTVDELISTNIYAGHQVTNSALFGIPPSDHSLGGNSGAELKMAYDIFKNTYVATKKKQAEEIINMLASAAGVVTKLNLIDIEPVGYTFSEATIKEVAPRSWLLEKLGIDVTKYPDIPQVAAVPGATVAGAQGEMVNEHLKNLTGKQMQNVSRIIRKYKNGQLDEAMAVDMLKNGYGLTDEQANKYLGIADNGDQFAEEDVALLFAAHGEPRENFKVYEKQKATFKEDVTDLESKIDIVRAKNPKATAESIANTLNVDVAVVNDYLKGAGGIINKIPKFEVRYSYEKRSDVSGPEVLPTTRPFCKKLIALDRFYTRADIQKISQYLGYDVMRRAGGFWNNDGTVEYHCRHEFFSQIVVKK